MCKNPYPIAFNALGERHRDFSDAVTLLRDDGLKQDIEGPLTVLTIANSAKARGHTFKSEFERWRSETKLVPGDRSIYEAEVITTVLDAIIQVDQLNAPNLLSAELLARRWQLIKEAHRINPASPDYNAADFFMGWRHKRAGVGQALNRFVAEEVKDETAMLKELRKAREESAAASSGGGRGRWGHKGGGRGRGNAPADDA